jgi:phosphate uptake regulator
MEIRKVQVTGGSSYVVSLPKTWIKSLNIKKNDPIGLIIQPDNSIVVTNRITDEKPTLTKEFDIDLINNPDFLFRSLIGAYIAGFDNIKILSKQRIPPFARNTVRQFTQMTIGQEVIEETESYIIVKDLLNPLEMPFNSTIGRMHIIVKGMHEDAIKTLKERDHALAEEVILRDNDVDRLHWLMARQSSILLKNVNLAEKMNIKPGMVINYFLISRFIERIGDHAVYIIKNIQNLDDIKLDKKIVNLIESADRYTIEIFDKSIESLFKKKIQLANDSIKSVPKIVDLCKKINTEAISKRGLQAISLGYIVESIRRTGVYSGDIAESVINHIVRGDT